MRPWTMLALLGGTLLAGCSGAGGGAPPEPWGEAEVAAGWSLALGYDWPSGQAVAWEWQTAGGERVRFQVVHTAPDGRPYVMWDERGSSAQGERLTPQAGRYDLVWDNEGPVGVTLRYRAPDGGEARSWPPGQGPACPPPLLLPC